MAKKIHWWKRRKSSGVSDRTMRRWRERLEGYSGLRLGGRETELAAGAAGRSRSASVATIGGDGKGGRSRACCCTSTRSKQWFGEESWHDLIYAQLVEQESMRAAMAGVER